MEDILAYLERKKRSTPEKSVALEHGLHGIVDPLRVYLTCYRVLKASEAPRASDILTTARQLLQEQAAKIDDDELRRSFLESVPVHREIVKEAERLSAGHNRSASRAKDLPRV